jgi:iron only hydrogenase large subunit-like protein
MKTSPHFYFRKKFGKGTQWTRPPTSVAFSNSRVILPTESTENQDFQPVPLSDLQALTSSTYRQDGSTPFAPLPMFCSHCPGWVCYAEKTQPQCLPYISTVKSPQQIIGSILKHILTKFSLSTGSSSSSLEV